MRPKMLLHDGAPHEQWNERAFAKGAKEQGISRMLTINLNNVEKELKLR